MKLCLSRNSFCTDDTDSVQIGEISTVCQNSKLMFQFTNSLQLIKGYAKIHDTGSGTDTYGVASNGNSILRKEG